MTVQQTVIVVVPFAALVDDIVSRGEAAGLDCEEWVNKHSGHELQQLIVVSADRAVQGDFLHYAKGLELGGQLAHVFFDEVHVAFTDTSYRERLRELWTLRYLDCPFTGLTATLMIPLEDTLKERLCIDNARIFRRNTARRTVRYEVRDSKDETPSDVAIKYVQQMTLAPGKRGVVYVRSYGTGRVISSALECPFYRARAEEKGEVLQQWIAGTGGWIIATGALGTGINIEGIAMIIHVGRPYGLTSFVQQSGRGGRNGEVSESVIITRVENSSGWKRREIMSEYSVEQVDEDAMTEFIQSSGCRRVVLGQYMDGIGAESNCHQTDSVFCDRCKIKRSQGFGVEVDVVAGVQEAGLEASPPDPGIAEGFNGTQMIQKRLQAIEESHEQMIGVMDELQGHCIYCRFIRGGDIGDQGAHTYPDCILAEQSGCGYQSYQGWREGVDLGTYQHCYKCGLCQKVCRRLEDDGWCEYPDIMLPGLYVLYQQQHLQGVVEAVGFQGESKEDIWEWLKEVGEGFGTQWESHWMKTWRMACQIYIIMKG
jgi:superfamily II DNA or RNA helicase